MLLSFTTKDCLPIYARKTPNSNKIPSVNIIYLYDTPHLLSSYLISSRNKKENAKKINPTRIEQAKQFGATKVYAYICWSLRQPYVKHESPLLGAVTIRPSPIYVSMRNKTY